MRNLVNVGQNENVYLDADLVVLIMPNEQKGFGSLIFMDGAPAPIGTTKAPDEVMRALKGSAPVSMIQ